MPLVRAKTRIRIAPGTGDEAGGEAQQPLLLTGAGDMGAVFVVMMVAVVVVMSVACAWA